MKILIAPDSYKGCLSAAGVAQAMAFGCRTALEAMGRNPEGRLVAIPLADGGEGTVEALVTATGGKIIYHTATGPCGSPVQGFYGILGDGETAVVEVAAASGLTLVPAEQRNPMLTTSLGTGELIRAVLDKGISKLLIGLGGSATNDGGMGILSALGVKFLDGQGQPLQGRGTDLLQVTALDTRGLDPRLDDLEMILACDVTNPFHGPQGAAFVYAPQKGADSKTVRLLDEGLDNLAGVFRRQMGVDVQAIPGAGAAGGIGGGLTAVLGAKFRPGIEVVMEAARLTETLPQVELVLTGEGRTDRQTAYGKAPVGLAQLAAAYGKPVVCLSGSLGEGYPEVLNQGISAVFSILPRPMSLEEAQSGAARYIQETAEMIVRLYLSKV